MNLPKYIKIGGSRYTCVPRDSEWRDEYGVDGLVRPDLLEISIVTEDRPPTEVANTFIHELLHVCYSEWQISSHWHEERTVTALGYALSAIFAQNPEVMRYIEYMLGDPE